jgi:uncharacterized protein YbjT (DUF2867 family)
MLARELIARGHPVRGTTRDPERVGMLEAAGVEAVIADPDRDATLIDALEHVTVACILLGSATGTPEQLAALHGTRLQMLMTKLIDTTVRGVVYEAAGSVDPELLRGGAELVREFGARAVAEVGVLEVDPGDHAAWLAAALDAIGDAL